MTGARRKLLVALIDAADPTPRQRTIMEAFWLHERSAREIAEDLDLCRERVYQLERHCCSKIINMLGLRAVWRQRRDRLRVGQAAERSIKSRLFQENARLRVELEELEKLLMKIPVSR